MEQSLNEFINKLSSSEPTPGGGGASALIGAIGVSLCSMVANLTSGKKKYAQYQEDIDKIIIRTHDSTNRLLSLIQKDAEAFTPLANAYGLPKETPNRDEILEDALNIACSVPVEILKEIISVIDVLEQLYQKGSKLAVSDVGVAASACRCGIEGAVMNIYINTKLMKNKDNAEKINSEAEKLTSEGILRCQVVYQNVLNELKG